MKLLVGCGVAIMMAAIALGQVAVPGGRRPVRPPIADPRTAGANGNNGAQPGPTARAPNPMWSKLHDPLTPPQRKTQAAAVDLSGQWTGIYTINDHVLLTTMTLT